MRTGRLAIFYLLLIVPHLMAMAGLLAYAYRTGVASTREDGAGGTGESPGPPPPPSAPPPPGPEITGPPLADANPPRHRIPAGQRLADLHPRPPRRPHAPDQPQRTPSGAEPPFRP